MRTSLQALCTSRYGTAHIQAIQLKGDYLLMYLPSLHQTNEHGNEEQACHANVNLPVARSTRGSSIFLAQTREVVV